MDRLVSFNWSRYSRARPEIIAILKRFGDPQPEVEKTNTIGIAVVHTHLDYREVIKPVDDNQSSHSYTGLIGTSVTLVRRMYIFHSCSE